MSVSKCVSAAVWPYGSDDGLTSYSKCLSYCHAVTQTSGVDLSGTPTACLTSERNIQTCFMPGWKREALRCPKKKGLYNITGLLLLTWKKQFHVLAGLD